MTDFDDVRLVAAMRAYVRAVDEVAQAGWAGDDKAVLDRADQRAIAAMAVRRRLLELGWSPPNHRVAPGRPAD
jgi:hypothetical protein